MPLVRVRDGSPATAQHALELLNDLASRGFSAHPSGDGIVLYVRDAVGRDVTQYEGADLLECIETLMRKTERAKTLPPPRDRMQTLPDNIAALRGKP